MAISSPELSQQLTGTIISLQQTVRNVKLDLEKKQDDIIFDPKQPIGHLLDNTDSTSIILSLAKPTKETTEHLDSLSARLQKLQLALTQREQWRAPPDPTPAIPCSTEFLDLSDLSTAVDLISNVVRYSSPTLALTPHAALANRMWEWDPLWHEFFSLDGSSAVEMKTAIYLSRWYYDPRREIWHHANMADSDLLPDDAQQTLGSWEDWKWDAGSGEWGLDVSHELEELQREEGGRLYVFASRWQEREGVWMYVGARG